MPQSKDMTRPGRRIIQGIKWSLNKTISYPWITTNTQLFLMQDPWELLRLTCSQKKEESPTAQSVSILNSHVKAESNGLLLPLYPALTVCESLLTGKHLFQDSQNITKQFLHYGTYLKQQQQKLPSSTFNHFRLWQNTHKTHLKGEIFLSKRIPSLQQEVFLPVCNKKKKKEQWLKKKKTFILTKLPQILTAVDPTLWLEWQFYQRDVKPPHLSGRTFFRSSMEGLVL